MKPGRSSAGNTVLLTATITPPPGATHLARIDPALRLEDYRRAFDFYCGALAAGVIDQLIFAENSESDIGSLRDIAEKHGVTAKTEFITLPGLDYPPEYGRGYGEFMLVNRVMASSLLIRRLPDDAPIWKVTGRYILKNIAEIIATRPAGTDFYCHCRNMPTRWIDLFVLCWNKKSHAELLDGIYLHLREDLIHGPCEPAFRERIEGVGFRSAIVKRFRTVPRLEGHRGVDGHSYEAMNMKLRIRQLANVLAPWLWV